MYSMVTIVNNTVYLKVAKRVGLKSFYHRKEMFVTMYGDRR